MMMLFSYYTSQPTPIELLPMFEWLFCYAWKESCEKYRNELKSGKVSVIQPVVLDNIIILIT